MGTCESIGWYYVWKRLWSTTVAQAAYYKGAEKDYRNDIGPMTRGNM